MNEIRNRPPLSDVNYNDRNERLLRIDIKAVVIVCETIAIGCLLTALIILLGAYNEDEEYIYTESSRVFEYYGEKDIIKLWDPTYGDTWLEALTDVPKHTYDFSSIKTQGGYKYYFENGEAVSLVGIDVSYFQGDIDWNRVYNDGVEFAMIRMGYRGYETGAVNVDERFHEYVQGALDAGIQVGVYFYSQAVTPDEAEEEALAVIREIEGYDITYPVVYDWEIVGEESARTNDVSVEALNECCTVFCNTIAKAGYIPMIYSVKRMALQKLDLSRLSGFDFWLAEYRDIPEFPYNFTMWQYASDGKVDGIDGEVDLNISFVDYSKIRRYGSYED